MNLRTTALAALLVTSVVGAAAAPVATQQAQGEAYSGTFVQFETGTAAVTDYAVDGQVVIENVTAQSASDTEGGIGIGADAASSTSISGSAISSQTSAEAGARASVAFESGAEMEAHDNQRGVVQVHAGDGDQVVQADVSGEASSESEERVVVRNDDGSSGVFIVVGDGNVTTNADGQVTAHVEQGSQLVYRQYNEGRSESEKQQERMIQNGTATAEVYVHGAAESTSEAAEDDDTATATETPTDDADEAAARGHSVVTYGQDTTVEITERSEGQVNMTVERTKSQGKVVITTVSEAAVENTEDLEVFVDGEAAAQADAYSEVESAAQSGDSSKFLVRQSSSAQAAVDVVVGINHFSERSVSMRSAEDGGESTATDGDGSGDEAAADGDQSGSDDTSDGDGAGFGVAAALVALAAALIAVRTRT